MSCLMSLSEYHVSRAEVTKILSQKHDDGEVRGFSVLGKPVCWHACQVLLGLGSSRMNKLRQAASKREDPPWDGRFLPQTCTYVNSKRKVGQREVVTEFLEELYNTVAEPMPEMTTEGSSVPQIMRFRRHRRRRPKMAVKQSRLKDKSSMRLLPPGAFSDYLGLLNARLPPDEKIRLKLFSSVTWVRLVHFVRFHSAQYAG